MSAEPSKVADLIPGLYGPSLDRALRAPSFAPPDDRDPEQKARDRADYERRKALYDEGMALVEESGLPIEGAWYE